MCNTKALSVHCSNCYTFRSHSCWTTGMKMSLLVRCPFLARLATVGRTSVTGFQNLFLSLFQSAISFHLPHTLQNDFASATYKTTLRTVISYLGESHVVWELQISALAYQTAQCFSETDSCCTWSLFLLQAALFLRHCVQHASQYWKLFTTHVLNKSLSTYQTTAINAKIQFNYSQRFLDSSQGSPQFV